MAAEFASATLEYAIVFAGTEAVIPVAVLGVRTDENLYITQQGGWHVYAVHRRGVPGFAIRAAAASDCSAKMGKPTPLCGERAQIPAAIPARIPPHPGILQKAQGSEFAPTHAGAGRYWCWGTLSAGGILGRGSCKPQDMSATVLEEFVGSD